MTQLTQPQAQTWLMIATAVYSIAYVVAFSMDAAQGDHPVGGDFGVFWNTSRDLHVGSAVAIYDSRVESMHRILYKGELIFENDGPFPYPPHFLLFLWPLAFLNFYLAYAIWIGMGFAGFLWVMTRPGLTAQYPAVKEWAGRYYPAIIATSLFSLVNLIAGQTGFFVAILFLAGWFGRKSHPVLAGICFGLLTFKPHVGLLIPIILLLERNWRCIGSAALTAGALAFITTLCFGVDIWQHFLDHNRVFLEFIHMSIPHYLLNGMFSVFYSAYYTGFSESVAYAAQLVASLAVIAVILRYYTRIQEESWRAALVLLGSAVLSPYSLTHDIAIWLPVWFMLANAFLTYRKSWIFLVMALLGFMPLLVRGMNNLGLPVSPLLVILFIATIIYLGMQAKNRPVSLSNR